ncbi:MAG: hypothetical protein ACO2OR_01120 [Desulfurococcaceae archaeon]
MGVLTSGDVSSTKWFHRVNVRAHSGEVKRKILEKMNNKLDIKN